MVFISQVDSEAKQTILLLKVWSQKRKDRDFYFSPRESDTFSYTIQFPLYLKNSNLRQSARAVNLISVQEI